MVANQEIVLHIDPERKLADYPVIETLAGVAHMNTQKNYARKSTLKPALTALPFAALVLVVLGFIPLQAHANNARYVVEEKNGAEGKRVSVTFAPPPGISPKLAQSARNITDIAPTSDCEDSYFSPEDANHEYPLESPHPELTKSLKRAKAGHAIEQRNVAVSYDAGYLVASCPEKAYYWYKKAAENNDQIARDWLARRDKFKTMHDGLEFMTLKRTTSPRPSVSASRR